MINIHQVVNASEALWGGILGKGGGGFRDVRGATRRRFFLYFRIGSSFQSQNQHLKIFFCKFLEL